MAETAHGWVGEEGGLEFESSVRLAKSHGRWKVLPPSLSCPNLQYENLVMIHYGDRNVVRQDQHVKTIGLQ